MKAMFVQRILMLQLFSILILNFTRSILLLIRFAAVVTITRAYSFGVLLSYVYLGFRSRSFLCPGFISERHNITERYGNRSTPEEQSQISRFINR
jgi:hypothetical protein